MLILTPTQPAVNTYLKSYNNRKTSHSLAEKKARQGASATSGALVKIELVAVECTLRHQLFPVHLSSRLVACSAACYPICAFLHGLAAGLTLVATRVRTECGGGRRTHNGQEVSRPGRQVDNS